MPTITEIMVVSKDKIYVERSGVLQSTGRRFVSDKVTEAIIERIVTRVGRRIDKSQPLVDARLTDGSRVNAIIAPLAVSGPALTIRKFVRERLSVSDLTQPNEQGLRSLTPTVARFLKAAVLARRNIIISGGTGSGKTTLLNCLSEFIPDKERIVTVEDTAELQLNKDHVVRLETKNKSLEGTGAFTIRDLVCNTLRMRPDRIVVGECRGAEALDMLQAMNTGHDGSLTTLHANSPEDALLRLEVLVRSGSDLPIDSIRRQIASAVNLILQIARDPGGHRHLTHVSELTGIDPSTGLVQLRHLFHWTRHQGIEQLVPTGRLPTFMPLLIERQLLALEAFYGDELGVGEKRMRG
jgi:pilus assembly protein CpaF